jgi:hypothetical protein
MLLRSWFAPVARADDRPNVSGVVEADPGVICPDGADERVEHDRVLV